MTDTGVPDDLGPTDDPDADETAEPPKTSAAPLRVTKGTGRPGWMSRPVHRGLLIRRSTLLLVVLLAGFEFLHIQYPSQPKAPSAPAGYVPAFIPAVTPTTTTTTTTTLPVTPTTTTTTTTPGPKTSSTTTTTKVGSGSSTTTTTTSPGATGSTTTTVLPGLGGTTTTTTTTTTFPS